MTLISVRAVRTGGAVLLAAAFHAGFGAYAAPFPNETIRLADLLGVDPLGYECIAASDLEVAFQATEKPFRLPRTCLSDPCERRLTRPELGELVGRPPADDVWQDYVERHDRLCESSEIWAAGATVPPRREELVVRRAPIAAGPDRPLRDAWRVAGVRFMREPVFRMPGGGPSRSIRSTPGGQARGVPEGEAEPSPPQQIGTVPLPPAILLLSIGLMALCRYAGRR